DSDYLQDETVFDTFYKTLSGKRLIVYSGLFKDASKKYENKELEHYKEIDPTHYIYQIFYHWGQTDYIQTEKKLMSEDMQKEEKQHRYLKTVEPTHYIYQIFYHWRQTDYIQTEQKLMSEDMQKEVNQTMLEETDIEE